MTAIPLIDAQDLIPASLQKRPFSRDDWLFELKFPALLLSQDRQYSQPKRWIQVPDQKGRCQVDLISRQGNSLTAPSRTSSRRSGARRVTSSGMQS